MSSTRCLVSVVSCVLLVVFVVPEGARAQRDPDAREAFLEARGLDDRAEDVEDELLDRLEDRNLGTERQRERTADFFSFILSVSGVTEDGIERLEEKGIDIIHAITATSRPLMEQSILVDLAVVGSIVGHEENGGLADDHRHTLTVMVTDTLKGTVPSDTIFIRQKRRVAPQSPDPRPEVGETFLFLVSNGVYRYYLHRNPSPNARPPEAEIRRRYSMYRRYRIREGRLLWEGRSREETRRALKSIETLDGWMRSWER